MKAPGARLEKETARELGRDKNTVVERRKCSPARENYDSWFRQLPLKPLRKIFSVESGKGADGNFLISLEKGRENPFLNGGRRETQCLSEESSSPPPPCRRSSARQEKARSSSHWAIECLVPSLNCNISGRELDKNNIWELADDYRQLRVWSLIPNMSLFFTNCRLGNGKFI